MSNNFVSIEKFAAILPCQFCGQNTNKAIMLKGCKERKYSDVVFVTCDSCMDTIQATISDHIKK